MNFENHQYLMRWSYGKNVVAYFYWTIVTGLHGTWPKFKKNSSKFVKILVIVQNIIIKFTAWIENRITEANITNKVCNYLHRRLVKRRRHCDARRVSVRRVVYITYPLHAALVSAAKVMRCIKGSLVLPVSLSKASTKSNQISETFTA